MGTLEGVLSVLQTVAFDRSATQPENCFFVDIIAFFPFQPKSQRAPDPAFPEKVGGFYGFRREMRAEFSWSH
ncbi:MAG TPA: hypothetical protein VNK24_01345 [Elusimicrobiota bacterium]|nr:hypothetical protein [Elusimicrobiota bacterium]